MVSKTKARFVFLDRDGILNHERGDYTYLPKHLDMAPKIGETLQLLQKKGYRFLVITNQSGIAKGRYRVEDMHRINELIQDYLKPYGVTIEAFYFCPHHPDHGKCLCRKPGSLLFEKAIHRFNVDRAASIMIGDKPRDVDPAARLGMQTMLVPANEPLYDRILNWINNE